MALFDKLISHRFRGFSQYENTIDGLTSALDAQVRLIEFDIRVTRCGTPVIYHDEAAPADNGEIVLICQTVFKDFNVLGGTFSHIPTADALFEAIARHPYKTTTLLLDIKDYGFEVEIDALLRAHGLATRSHYVSWLPEVLFRMSEIAPDIPLCFSHWPALPSEKDRELHHVHLAPDGQVKPALRSYIHGERSGWYVEGGLKGALRDILIGCEGSVCLPVNMIHPETLKAYQADGIKVSAFSFTDTETLKAFDANHGLDMYFVDNHTLFADLA